MSEAAGAAGTPAAGAGSGSGSVTVESTERAVVARVNKKMMADEELKTLRTLIDEASAANPTIPLVVIDLAAVSLLPSLALGLIVQISNKCKAREQTLKLAAVQPQVRQVFAITRLDRLFEFAPDVQQAIG
jgi:anti-sigma B factor antagonist